MYLAGFSKPPPSPSAPASSRCQAPSSPAGSAGPGALETSSAASRPPTAASTAHPGGTVPEEPRVRLLPPRSFASSPAAPAPCSGAEVCGRRRRGPCPAPRPPCAFCEEQTVTRNPRDECVPLRVAGAQGDAGAMRGPALLWGLLSAPPANVGPARSPERERKGAGGGLASCTGGSCHSALEARQGAWPGSWEGRYSA